MIYGTALPGIHHQRLLREFGLLPINRVTAAKAGARKPRRNDRRVEKSIHLEDRFVIRADGTSTTVSLFARAGLLRSIIMRAPRISTSVENTACGSSSPTFSTGPARVAQWLEQPPCKR